MCTPMRKIRMSPVKRMQSFCSRRVAETEHKVHKITIRDRPTIVLSSRGSMEINNRCQYTTSADGPRIWTTDLPSDETKNHETVHDLRAKSTVLVIVDQQSGIAAPYLPGPHAPHGIEIYGLGNRACMLASFNRDLSRRTTCAVTRSESYSPKSIRSWSAC